MSDEEYIRLTVKDFNNILHKITDILQDVNKALKAQNILILEVSKSVRDLKERTKNGTHYDA